MYIKHTTPEEYKVSKKKKMYPPMKGGFRFKKNAKQWIRPQDIDQAIYYPNSVGK